MKIPKDFGNEQNRQMVCGHPLSEIVPSGDGTQYCAQCAREKQPSWSLRRNVIRITVLFILSLVCVTSVLLVSSLARDRRQSAAISADKVSITESLIYTSTAAPTDTPLPTTTPYPTFTHTPAPVQMEHTTVIQTRIIEVTRLVIVSATPQPTAKATHTATPTPVPTSTDEPLWLQQSNQQIEIAMRKAETQIRFAEWATHPAVLTIILMVILISLLTRNAQNLSTRFSEWLDSKTKLIEQPLQASTGVSADLMELLDMSDKLYPDKPHRFAGHRDIWPDNSERWGTAIDELRALGYVVTTIRGNRGGTFIYDKTRADVRADIERI